MKKKYTIIVSISIIFLVFIICIGYRCYNVYKVINLDNDRILYQDNYYNIANECWFEGYSEGKIISKYIPNCIEILNETYYSNEINSPKTIFYQKRGEFVYFREDIDYKNIEMLFYLYSDDSESRIITHLGNCTFNDLIAENVDLDIEDWKQYSQFKMRLNSIGNDVYYHIELYLIKIDQYYIAVRCPNNIIKYFHPSAYFFEVCEDLIE